MIDRREVLVQVGGLVLGEVAKMILELLLRRGEMTDEELSSELNMPVNDVRRVLHKLFEMQLVRYRRVRDPKVGWYSYLWRVTDERPEIVLEQRKRKVIEKLKELLRYETENSFFACPQCRARYTYGEALSSMFQCPTCGSYLEEYDNSKRVRALRELIERLASLKIE